MRIKWRHQNNGIIRFIRNKWKVIRAVVVSFLLLTYVALVDKNMYTRGWTGVEGESAIKDFFVVLFEPQHNIFNYPDVHVFSSDAESAFLDIQPLLDSIHTVEDAVAHFLNKRREKYLVVVPEGFTLISRWYPRVMHILEDAPEDAVLFLGPQAPPFETCNSRVCKAGGGIELIARRGYMTRLNAPTFQINPPLIVPRVTDVLVAPKVLLAVLVKNRKFYVEKQARSLHMSQNHSFSVLVCDDGSIEFSTQYLKSIYPNVMNVIRVDRELNSSGPSSERGNFITRFILERFNAQYRTFFSHLVIVDSDMIFNPFWLEDLSKLIDTVPDAGLYSVYNSCSHPNVACVPFGCRKESLGNAGTVWSSNTIEKVLAADLLIEGFDWAYSKHLREVLHLEMWATSPSLVEHIGVNGSHGTGSVNEMSMDFHWEDLDPKASRETKENLVQRRGCGVFCQMSQLESFNFKQQYSDNYFLYCEVVRIWNDLWR